MPEAQDAHRQAARKRGAAVLADLVSRAGLHGPAEVARRSELAGVTISDQTVSNLLSARVRARDTTVLKFITACLHEQDGNHRLAAEKATKGFWKARFDDALGRAGEPTAGMVRIGQPPPAPVVFVERPDVIVLAAEAKESVVLLNTDQDGAGHGESDKSVDARPNHSRSHARWRPVGEQSLVLSGMGGVGKSQLAAHYARHVWRDPSLDLLVWVSARSSDSVVSAYAQAAAELIGAETNQPEQAAQRLMAWLSTTPRSWLIVLDDVQLPNKVQPWWPEPTESGQVIMTTRYRGEGLLRPGRHVVEVGTYTSEQARDYLQHRLVESSHLYQDPDSPPGDLLDDLADDLGRLPLALTHAAAYMRQEDMPVREYRSLLRDHQTRLSTVFPHHDELPDADLDTVATTWQISMDLAARLAPGGVVALVMLLASLLDPDGIPREVFVTDAVTTYLDGVLEQAVTERKVWSAIHVLHRLSLLTIDRHTPHRAVRVHALVQRATREAHGGHVPSTSDAVMSAAWAAADALLEIWPEIERDTALAAALRSNAQVIHAVTERALWTPAGHDVLFRAGNSLGEAGLLADAISYFHILRFVAQAHLGPSHRHTLVARGQHAHWRGEAGDSVGAAAALAELLDDLVRVLGPDHPDTLTARSNLAFSRGEAGDPAGAAAALAELLDDQKRVLGRDHRHTLATRRHIARWIGEAGDPVGAAATFAELVDDLVRVLGPDHPDTLTARSNLAQWRGEAGDPAGAAAAFAELVDDHTRVLGGDHLRTLTTRNSLARWIGEAGDPVGAAAAFAELLDDMVLESGSVGVLAIRVQLARWRGEAGDPAGAAAALVALLDDYTQMLGPDHRHTLITRNNLARWIGEAGDSAGAAAAFAELLDDLMRVLGPDHPDTLTARSNLDFWRRLAAESAR